VFLDLLDSIVVQIAPDRLEQSQQRIANRLKVMRAFDLECFDHPVQADFDNDSLESIQSKNLQLQLCRQEKQNLRDELEEQCRELEEQCRNFAQLKTEYEELLGRLDWRLLMKINRLPGVAAIKRLLRPLVSRILKL
jgi:DNA repair ATPase RecN